jgi:uncharacterized protein
MDTRFEWDPDKARSNLKKHGISFEAATFAFDDPYAVTEIDRIEGGEYRWQTIGMAFGVSLLLVAHTVEDEDVEVIRIISARRAEPSERRKYEQQDR